MRTHTVLALLLFILITVYGTVQARFIIFGPTIHIIEPAPNSTVPSAVTLFGTVENATYLTVNDRRVFPNKQGMFETTLLLPAGYTIVEVYAHSRQKRKTVIHLPLHIKKYDDNKKENSNEE